MEADEQLTGPGRLVSAQTLASFYDVSVRTVKNWEKLGIIPPAIRLHNNLSRYDLDASRAAIDERAASIQRAIAE